MPRPALFRLAPVVGIASALSVSLLACKPRHEEPGAEVKGNVSLEQAPPSVLYHFGSYRYLHPFGNRSSSFTESEWRQMPSLTPRYGGSSRAGFYTSQHPAYNERYEDKNVENARDDSPWMLTVKLNADCTHSSKWLDVRAKRWVNCSERDFVRSQAIPDACNDEIRQYIDAEGKGVVKDFWWDGFGFWYVTDRTCIESLDATPEGYLKAAATVPEFWRMAPYTSDKSRDSESQAGYDPGQVDFVILARALSEVATPDQEILDQLAAAAAGTDLSGISAALKATTQLAAACAKAGRFADFKSKMAVFVGKFDAGTFKSESLSFNTHASNLVRYGLAKLGENCDAAAAATPALGPSDPKAMGFLKRFAGVWSAPDGSFLRIAADGSIEFKHHDWADARPMQIKAGAGYTTIATAGYSMNLVVGGDSIVGADSSGAKFNFSR